MSRMPLIRSRWAAIGAAVAVTLGAGGLYAVRAASAPSVFVAIAPTRILDTRLDVGLSGQFTTDQGRTLQVTGQVPIVVPVDQPSTGTPVPTGATAIVANVTAVSPTASGFVSVRPGDATGTPSTSNLNVLPGDIVPNSVTVELAPNGTINLYYKGSAPGAVTHLLVDIVGYYQTGGSTGATGPAGPTGPAGNTAKQQRLVTFTNGPSAPIPADVEVQPAIALGADRVPVIAYFNDTVDDLQIVRCVAACVGTTSSPIESTGSVGWAPSIAIGSDGLAVISYGGGAGTGVKVRHCSDVACTASTATNLDPAASANTPSSIAIGTDGFPIIAYPINSADVRTAKCGDVLCNPGLATITTHTTPVQDDLGISIAIGSDGLPVIVHQTGAADLVVTRCANVACTSSTQVTADNQTVNVGYDASIAIGADGFPVIAHRILSDNTLAGSDLRITRCTNITCSTAVSTTVDGVANRTGFATSIAVGADGVPIVAHRDDTAGALKISRCTDATCAAVETIPSDAGPGSGNDPAIVIDAFGLPVIAHGDTTSNSDIRLTILTAQGWGP